METGNPKVRIYSWLWVGRCVTFLGLVLPVPGIAPGQSPKLQFVKRIGVGWDTDKWAWMSYVAFNRDGTMVAADAATAREDISGDLTLWSFPEGRLIRKVKGQPGILSSDWKYMANVHGVTEVETGRLVIALKENEYAGFAFTPDSRYVVETSVRHLFGTKSGREIHHFGVRVVELASGKETMAFGQHAPQSVAVSPDGKTLAAGYWNAVALWDLATGKRVAVLPGIGRYVRGLAFNKVGSLLAAGTDTGGLQIWDVRNQTQLHSIEVGGGDVSDPAFSPDGKLVAVGIYGTGTVFLIDVRTGKVVDQQLVSGIGCGSVAFSPDGRYMITPSTGGLVRWPYDRGGTIRVFAVVGR